MKLVERWILLLSILSGLMSIEKLYGTSECDLGEEQKNKDRLLGNLIQIFGLKRIIIS